MPDMRADGATGLSSMHALTGERLTLRDQGATAQQAFQQQVPLCSADFCSDSLTWSRYLVCEAHCLTTGGTTPGVMFFGLGYGWMPTALQCAALKSSMLTSLLDSCLPAGDPSKQA